MIRTKCTHCGQKYELDGFYESKKVECGKCNRQFIVPKTFNENNLIKDETDKNKPIEIKDKKLSLNLNDKVFKEENNKSKEFKIPFCSRFFFILSYLSISVSLGNLILCYYSKIIFGKTAPTEISDSFVAFFVCFLFVLFFGFVLKYLAKIEYNTKQNNME